MSRVFKNKRGDTLSLWMALPLVILSLVTGGLQMPLLWSTETAPPPAAKKEGSQPGTTSKARPWEGLQIQLLDEPLTLMKPLVPVTQDEERKSEALAWYGVAHFEFLRGNQKKAYESLKKAHAADPESAQLLYLLFQLAFANRQPEEAYGYALKLSAVNPQGSAELIRRLGALLVDQQKDIPSAVRLYEQAAKSSHINKESAFYVFLMKELGKLYVTTNRLPDAASCYETLFDAIRNHEKYQLSSRDRRELSNDPAVTPEMLAEVFLNVEKYDLARQAFEQASKKGKSSAGTLHYNLARIDLKQNHPEQGLEQLDLYFAADVTIKGRNPLVLLEETLKQLKREGELIGRLEGYLKLKPDQVNLMVFLAERYASANRLTDAEVLFKKALEEEHDQRAYVGLAEVSRRSAKIPEFVDNLAAAYGRKENIEVFSTELDAVSQDPKLWEAVWNLSQTRMKANPPELDYEAAFVVSQAAMRARQTAAAAELIRYAMTRRKTESAKLYEILAEHYMELDQYLQAGETYKQGADDLAVGDRRADFLIHGSQAYELGGKTDIALGMLADARKSFPEHPLIIYQEGWVYAHATQYDEAIQRFQKIIDTFKDESFRSIVRTTRLNLSNVYVLKGEIEKGENVLEEVLKDSPEDPSVNNDLGYLYADQGKELEKAEQMISKALKAEPENGAYLDSMGWVLHKLGKNQEALDFLKKSSEKSQTSSDATIWEHLGDVHQALNQTEEARKNWTKALEMARTAPKPDMKLIPRIEAKLK